MQGGAILTSGKQSQPDAPTVVLWRWPLLASFSEQTALWSLLSADERSRAERFRFARDRRRYVVVRGTLRRLLAARLGCPADAVSFAYGPFGKPVLRGAEPLSFNLSHCDELAVLAVTDGAPVGVDLERIRPVADDFAEHAFAAEERAALHALLRCCAETAVFACWTRREAYVKATGAGLSQRPGSFAVSIDPSRPAVLRIDAEPESVGQWTLADLAVQPGYAAALAVHRPSCVVQWQGMLPL